MQFGASRERTTCPAAEHGYKADVADGISQGAEQKAIETAKNFISMGIPFEQIAQGTGLPLETIEQIAKDNMLA